ncbi:MAG: SGNH/GDSL hydrolase family protein [Planctomycetes bacterium]|nr:SGNH/GDSL hydrolase family protein [Planctomycetota bacterium]
MSSLSRSVKRAVLALGGFVAALGAAEIVLLGLGIPADAAELEFLGPELGLADVFETDDELFWRLRAGATGLRVNELGLRGALPRGAKSAGDFRVLCVGDSSTFGIGVREEESWPRVLERSLQDETPRRRVAAIVAALPGWSTWQDRRLLEREATRFAPDLTVFYVGAWNDYVPAIGTSDRERTQRRDHGGSRLGRLIEGHARADRASYVAAFERGEAPDGRRVSPFEFRENLLAMFDAVTRLGGAICVVIPPIERGMRAKYPIGDEYRDALVQLAASAGARVIDARATFDEEDDALARVEPVPPGDRTHCFADGVHPTPHGHSLIAARVLAIARERIGGRGAADGEDEVPVVASVFPMRIPSLAGGEVALVGRGLERIDRARLDSVEVDVAARSHDRATIAIPACTAPGEHELVVLGDFGRLVAGRVTIAGPELVTHLEPRAGGACLVVEGRGVPGWRVFAWLGAVRTSAPLPTRYGHFELAHDRPLQLADRAWMPLRLDLLDLPRLEATVRADGRFEIRHDLDPAATANVPEQWLVQALIVDPSDRSRGVLSATAIGLRP